MENKQTIQTMLVIQDTMVLQKQDTLYYIDIFISNNNKLSFEYRLYSHSNRVYLHIYTPDIYRLIRKLAYKGYMLKLTDDGIV